MDAGHRIESRLQLEGRPRNPIFVLRSPGFPLPASDIIASHMDKEPSKVLIFDCDGVLIDSEGIGARIELKALRRLGCRLTFEEYLEAALGRTEEETVWRELAARSGLELPSDFAVRTQRKVADAFNRELKAIPGVEEVLGRLACPLCVASGSRPERLRRNLRLTRLDRFFGENIFSAAQVPRGKPHPDLFLYAAGQMGVPPGSCTVVEDSPAGVQGARAAGMRVFGFTGGSHNFPGLTHRLLEAGVERLFERMEQLPELLQM